MLVCIHNRSRKQTVSKEVNFLGGVTLKVLLPSMAQVLATYLEGEDLTLPAGPVTTVYRAEINGYFYYSRQYQRVKKRNSYTVS